MDDDIIVVAADNVFSHSLEAFGRVCGGASAPVLAVYDVGDVDEVRRYNAIEAHDEGRITFFEEKPAHPRSTVAGIALYYYPQPALALIGQYINEGNNPDQPGRLVEWMSRRTPVYTWNVPGTWLGIDSSDDLDKANLIFARGSAAG